jgi:hypothetical protein
VSTAAWETLFDDVLPEVSACAQNVAAAAIRRATIEFCRDTLVYSAILAPINVVAGQRRYILTPPSADVAVGMILNLSLGGATCHPVAPDELAANNPSWMRETGSPRGFMEPEPGTVEFFPIPDTNTTAGLQAHVALIPSQTALGAPAWLFEKHGFEIAEGAKHYLMLTPGRPYSNPTLADFYGRRFASAKTDAKNAANRGGARAGMRIQLRKS